MKNIGPSSFLVYLILFNLICFGFSCKKEPSREPGIETAQLVGIEIDTKIIEGLVGVQFKIMKTEVIGYMPVHKFYWVCLKERSDRHKVEELAYQIIKDTIAKKPKTYHSFTMHFFLEADMVESVEKSECYARATFLPEGNWLKVGRVPIDDYKNYKLTRAFFK